MGSSLSISRSVPRSVSRSVSCSVYRSGRKLKHVLGENIPLDLARPAVDGGGRGIIERAQEIGLDSGDILRARDDALFRAGLYEKLGQPLPGLHRPDLQHRDVLPEGLAALHLLDEAAV